MTKHVNQLYRELIYKRTYARWLDDKQRREHWRETVERYAQFFRPLVPQRLKEDFELAIGLLEVYEVMPSMRALWTAGAALEADNIAGYNCAYTPISTLKDFAEVLHILMNGTGVGVSVERQYITQLPAFPKTFVASDEIIVIEDSKEGWARGFQLWLERLAAGYIPKVDFSKIRPRGARLRTFGGRASGPEPLKALFDFILEKVLNVKEPTRKLTSDEVADIICKIAEIVVVGGVRRSAVMLLTNPSDRRMAAYKEGQFWETHPHRMLANVSTRYTEQPDALMFLEDFMKLMRAGTGERGFVNSDALKETMPVRRNKNFEFGLNPCGEIILRPKEFCNLTEVVARPNDDWRSLGLKLKAATLLGCLQSLLTDFCFIDSTWRLNCEDERLLGVSLTGIADCKALREYMPLTKLRETVVYFATEFSKILGIKTPAATTCIKPSGTVSQLVDSSSGIHPRFAPYYIRRVRIARTDPLAQLLMDQGVPWDPEVGQTPQNATTLVFSFPLCSMPNSVFRHQVTALDQLNLWLQFKLGYCEHNPSITVYVKEHEWLDVAAWLYKHWNVVSGITLLPYDGGVYRLAPYQEITEDEYKQLCEQFPSVDFKALAQYERDDYTEGQREYACVGGSCEL